MKYLEAQILIWNIMTSEPVWASNAVIVMERTSGLSISKSIYIERVCRTRIDFT